MQRLASLTTSDAAIRRETARPSGLRRETGVCGMAVCFHPGRVATRLAGLLG